MTTKAPPGSRSVNFIELLTPRARVISGSHCRNLTFKKSFIEE